MSIYLFPMNPYGGPISVPSNGGPAGNNGGGDYPGTSPVGGKGVRGPQAPWDIPDVPGTGGPDGKPPPPKNEPKWEHPTGFVRFIDPKLLIPTLIPNGFCGPGYYGLPPSAIPPSTPLPPDPLGQLMDDYPRFSPWSISGVGTHHGC